ncbi:ABC transporter ATP-binding protein [Ekhidna sp.]|uniref:ABC transporter ATP-binding protein n=1 Tax=Ekhidna sp. TaxID=2608089 RepID=UPI003298AF6E
MKLIIENLTKTYANGVKAIDKLNLQIGTGMFGLLGPNGAGKSSLMRTIATLQQPDTGSIAFGDIDVLNEQTELRKCLGYLPQSFGVYPRMSAEDLLDYLAALKGVKSKADRKKLVHETLTITNLFDVRKKYVAGYSGGMKQRFGIAQLLLNSPKLIIVDEPTAGLDPAERTRFLNVIREIGTKSTVIFSTHIVDDVKELCTDMAILNRGRILKNAIPQDVLKAFEGKIWSSTIDPEEFEATQPSFNVLSSNYNQENRLNIRIYSESKPDGDFNSVIPDLEDVYFHTLKEDERVVA